MTRLPNDGEGVCEPLRTEPLRSPELLNKRHKLEGFECGSPELDEFLARYARTSHAAGSAKVYVSCRGERVVGFYALASGGVEREAVPARVGAGLARHPVPILILARLAVDLREQRGGLGSSLLRDALRRVLEAAEIVGVRALVIHAKDDSARDWYLSRFEFDESPIDPHQLFLLVKDIRKAT